MCERIEVVYEHGVLRPVKPMPIQYREHQHLMVNIEDPNTSDDWLAGADPTVSLEKMRQILSKVPMTLTQLIHEEREER